MNKNNLKIWYESGRLHGEWSDRSLDDEDRYQDDSIIIEVSVEANKHDNISQKRLMAKMYDTYDIWFKETRGE